MLARGPSSAPLARCLTCRVLRIRQPASLRLALSELEVGPSRGLRPCGTRVRLEFLFSSQECNFHEACRKQRSCNLFADTFFSHCCCRSCSRTRPRRAPKIPQPSPSKSHKKNRQCLSPRMRPLLLLKKPPSKPNNSARSAKPTTPTGTWISVTRTPAC